MQQDDSLQLVLTQTIEQPSNARPRRKFTEDVDGCLGPGQVLGGTSVETRITWSAAPEITGQGNATGQDAEGYPMFPK